ncbi:hypothetical protein D0Z07_7980 [Hyphodiscus hymeniophilus]|uniref:Uncharacterized protein n=1 Tax=Hyphodiscus hymeniophilus TaxID=353542 RepID=A0A9P6SQW0_9HELO|nr:hypothetical protein D0Z07_7980 [Hyphodiscus hymeniophilus]
MEELKSKAVASPDTLIEDDTWYKLTLVFLPTNDGHQLTRHVRELLANDYDNEVGRGAHNRVKAFDQVSDPSVDGADLGAFRQRFKTMREQNEIPNHIATDYFLVVDEAVLNHPVISSKTVYQPKAPGEPDPWEYILSIRAVDPGYDVLVPVPSEEDLSGYGGEITILLPKVFVWLYYCFLAKSEDWETRYKVVKGGAAKLMGPSTPYPAYRS